MTTRFLRKDVSSAASFILDRWSPRSFVPAEITEAELLAILEAGRWAPSAYNHQPWRFIYARRSTPEWEQFLSWFIPFNRSWAEKASAIVYIASQTSVTDSKTGTVSDNATHAFDAGAASVLIQLQAKHDGWATHPVSGFDHARVHNGLGLSDDHALHAAIIIGRQGEKALLPEALQARENPSDRIPLKDIAFSGKVASKKHT